jgi:hypothetical protein
MLVSKECWERGCSCYDDRVDKDPVEVVNLTELTDQQVFDLADKHLYGGKNYNILSFYKAIEEKLRSKNDQA